MAMDDEPIVDRLARIYRDEGSRDYLGEELSMAEHMYQTAALAAAECAAPGLVAAALLHDIGHFSQAQVSATDWHRRHDEAGGDFLADHFDQSVVAPVRLHVRAKRYLCSRDEGYYETLSAASQHTFHEQGGPMSEAEVAAFEAAPFAAEALRLRRWEDAGKTAGLRVPGFAHYRALLEALLLPQQPSRQN